MNGSTFTGRMRELRERVGDGHLTGTVEVNQVYAHYQHEHLDFHHPRGGGAKYLEQPLMEHYREWLQRIGHTMLDDGGRREMITAMEELAGDRGVAVNAPVELGDLRASGHPAVADDGHVIYDRPPVMHRLSENELKAKSRAVMAMREALGLPVFFKKHGKIMVIPGTAGRVLNVITGGSR